MRILLSVALACCLLGCTSVVGKIDWAEQEATVEHPSGVTVTGTCQGIILTVGQHDTGCTSGGPISVPGAALIGGIFSGIADAARAFFGGGATTNINVTPEGVTLEE